MSCKKSLLVQWKVLRLLVNTLTADDKYSLLNRDNLMQPIQILLSQKQKTFPQFFSAFLQSSLNFEHFLKKRWPSGLIYFRNYILRKTWPSKCLKSPVSENPSRSNMVHGPKHCCNLDHSTFTIFIDHCEGNWVGKSLF